MKRPQLQRHAPRLLALALWAALNQNALADTPPGPAHTDPAATLERVALPWAGRLHNVLPPEERVRAMLLRQPTVQVARANVDAAAGRQARLNAGPHEWTFKAGVQQRREMPGPRYRESELAVERGLRLPAKLDADQALGRNEAEVGMLNFEDTWHESARALLKSWFDALREARTLQTLREQVALAEQQRSVAQRRRQGGERAGLNRRRPEADGGRARAAAQQPAPGCAPCRPTCSCATPMSSRCWRPPRRTCRRLPGWLNRPSTGWSVCWPTTTSWNWPKPRRATPNWWPAGPAWTGRATPCWACAPRASAVARSRCWGCTFQCLGAAPDAGPTSRRPWPRPRWPARKWTRCASAWAPKPGAWPSMR